MLNNQAWLRSISEDLAERGSQAACHSPRQEMHRPVTTPEVMHSPVGFRLRSSLSMAAAPVSPVHLQPGHRQCGNNHHSPSRLKCSKFARSACRELAEPEAVTVGRLHSFHGLLFRRRTPAAERVALAGTPTSEGGTQLNIAPRPKRAFHDPARHPFALSANAARADTKSRHLAAPLGQSRKRFASRVHHARLFETSS
jgi:hypothetical protein